MQLVYVFALSLCLLASICKGQGQIKQFVLNNPENVRKCRSLASITLSHLKPGYVVYEINNCSQEIVSNGKKWNLLFTALIQNSPVIMNSKLFEKNMNQITVIFFDYAITY
jgi:hypothetical protein